MAIEYERLFHRVFPEIEQAWTARTAMVYALGVGLGHDPLDERQLAFVYEKALRVLPGFASVLAGPGLWIREPDTGLDWEHVLHGEQGVEFLAPLPAAGRVRARTRVTGIVDKGAGRGALVYTERIGIDVDSGQALFRVAHTSFARNDGGFGGPAGPVRAVHPLPQRVPDIICDLPTVPQQALLFRLNGDPNPHNADPRAAAEAGFERPILQGLCTYGIAGHAVLRSCCEYDPARLRALSVRLSAPVLPGETVRTELWVDGAVVSFRTLVPGRGVVVLNNGRADIVPA